MTDLSLYVHIPFCRQRCNYCSFVSNAGAESQIPDYVLALQHEIKLTRRPDVIAKTVYFGGGTPSLLDILYVKAILGAIRNNYPLERDAEVTFEANPGTVDGTYLRNLQVLGISRLSLGIQSLDNDELKLLGRLHNAEEARGTVLSARAARFFNLNLDFIYGIPGRSLEKWREMLTEIVALGAEHLSLYALTLEEGTPLAESIKRGEMKAPDADAAAEEYELASEVLAGAGYQQYEISNWSRAGFESRHNLTYWTGGEYLGLGCGAHSYVDNTRRANLYSLEEYLSRALKDEPPTASTEVIDSDTALAEAIILGLRLNRGISVDSINKRFQADILKRYSVEVTELKDAGLLTNDNGYLKLTPRGRLLGNEVFLRFLPESEKESPEP